MTRRSLIQRFAAFLAAALVPKAVADAAIVKVVAPISGQRAKYDGILVDADGIPAWAKQRASAEPCACCGGNWAMHPFKPSAPSMSGTGSITIDVAWERTASGLRTWKRDFTFENGILVKVSPEFA